VAVASGQAAQFLAISAIAGVGDNIVSTYVFFLNLTNGKANARSDLFFMAGSVLIPGYCTFANSFTDL